MEVRMKAALTTSFATTYDVVVLGAGYAGLMAALRLSRRKSQLRIALVNVQDQFLERVRLQESIVTAVTPRIPSIAAFVAGTNIQFICGRLTSLDADKRRIRITTGAQDLEIAFDRAIYALGSNIDVDNVPDAHEYAYRLEAGDGPRTPPALRSKLVQNANKPLRVITVGGAETAVEVAGEIKTAWPGVEMTMISRTRCGDFRGARVEMAVRTELARLGVRMIDGESVIEVRPNEVLTDTGRSIACDVCVWSGGLRSAPIAKAAGLSTDQQGRIWVDANLRSISHEHVMAVGDAAHPIAPTGAPYRLSAFAALVSGAYVADAIVAQKANRRLAPFSYSTFGQGVAIGRGGVGFPSYPDDKQILFILKGRTARSVRNFFVWFLIFSLKLERRFPGAFIRPGRRRVSWLQANDAIQKVQTGQKLQTA
jgi:NADH dehydrogenase